MNYQMGWWHKIIKKGNCRNNNPLKFIQEKKPHNIYKTNICQDNEERGINKKQDFFLSLASERFGLIFQNLHPSAFNTLLILHAFVFKFESNND